MKVLFEQVNKGTLPDQPGEYITPHGNLYFNGEHFCIQTGNKCFKATVAWWLKQQVIEKKTKKLTTAEVGAKIHNKIANEI